MFGLLALGILCALCSWVLIEVFRRWAIKSQLLDLPNERSSHDRPTPRGGGVGIVLVVVLFWTVLQYFHAHEPLVSARSILRIGLVLTGALLIAVISWMDDVRRGLSPAFRLVVHTGAAGLVLIVTGGWSQITVPFIGTMALGWAGYFVAIVWIVGLVNAYNFMDGIDGLAGVQAVTAAAGWLSVGLIGVSPFLSAAGIVIGSSAIGFLIHNWPPAKVFMGDIGSAFLGYSFAVLPLCAGRPISSFPAGRLPFAGLLMVAPFILDASFTFLRRLSSGKKLTQAHRSHIYQRLVITGLSHRAVTLAYMCLGSVSSAAGVSFVFLHDRLVANIIAFVSVAGIIALLLFWVSSRERIAFSRT